MTRDPFPTAHEEETPAALGPRAAALVDLARGSLGAMSEGQRAAGLHALRARLGRGQGARRLRWAAGGAFAVAVAAALAVVPAIRRHDLSVRVEGGALDPSGTVAAAAGAAPVLRFSDGSEITMSPNARVRVRSIDSHGARVTVAGGATHVYVVHASDTHWTFEAGPFVVAVTGTAFGLSWKETAGRLDVRLENGTVTVTGPPSDAPISLHAGQWLTARGNDVTIRALTAAEPALDDSAAAADAGHLEGAAVAANAGHLAESARPAEATPAAQQPAPAPEIAPRHAQAERAEAHAPGSSTGSWRRELAAGRFEAIVDQAMHLGLDAAFARSPIDDLSALADAARYTRRAEIARGALEAVRRRFAGSEQARAAAFSLGRTAEAEGDARSALDWYDTYLAEAPNGTYAPEALGRKMALVEKVDGRGAARSLADAYLRRFPAGPYADAARALLSDGP